MTEYDILAVQFYDSLTPLEREGFKEEFDPSLYDEPVEVLNDIRRIDQGLRAYCLQ